jgi:hypothetical protein
MPPATGQTYQDPVFGTTIKRISDARNQVNADTGGNLVFITDEYSSMSPFNTDNSRLLLLSQSYFTLHDGAGNYVKNCPLEISASSEPRWSRSDPNLLYFVRGNQLKRYNAATDVISAVHTFGQYTAISGKGESDICFDGNHFVLVGDGRFVFVYEISSGRTGPVLDTGGRGFDSVYITPDDNVTVTWLQAGNSRYNGIELYDRNMNFLRQVSRAGGHMDVTRDTNGDEVLLLINAADPQPVCDNGVVKIRLSDGQQTCLMSLDWSLAVHISAPDTGGWCFVETYAPGDPTSEPLWTRHTNEVVQLRLDGNEVRRLAHHRSRPFNSYNWQPHVAVSRDGTRLIYNSNFSLQVILGYPSEYSDVYMMSVPPAAGGSGNTGTGTTTGSTPSLVEDDNAAVTYTGTWFLNSLVGHSSGSARLAMDAGSRAAFTFSGTAVNWIGYRDEWSGIASVYVDGQPMGTVDTYASPLQYKAVLFSATGLPAGSHTLTIEITGNRNPASGGSWIWVDAFQVASGGSSTVPNPAPPPAPSRFEEDAAAVRYQGAWHSNSLSVHSRGGALLAMDRGARATFTFSGTGVSWIAYRDQWSGIANVYLDGKLLSSIDTYASPARAQSQMHAINGLPAGVHTLTIEATGQKRSASRGRWVWVDAFDVKP